jgi:O-antigen/teichoic acid export membrane protein
LKISLIDPPRGGVTLKSLDSGPKFKYIFAPGFGAQIKRSVYPLTGRHEHIPKKSMFKKLLAFFKQSAIYGIGTIFERLVSFLMLPLYLNALSRAEFGLVTAWQAYFMIISPFFLFGQNSALIRFYSDSDDEKERTRIFATAWWSVVGVGSILIGIGLLATQPLALLLFEANVNHHLLWLMFGVIGLDSMNLLASNLLKAENRATLFSGLSLLSGLMILAATYYFMVLREMKADGAIMAIFVVSLFKFIILLWLVILPRLRLQFSSKLLRQMLQFGLPYLPTVLAASLLVSIDRIFIDQLLGKEVLGIYAAGCRLAMLVALFTKAFQFAWEPFIAATHDQDDAPMLFSKIFTYFFGVAGFLYLAIVLFIGDLIQFRVGSFTFAKPEYFASVNIVPIVMLGSMLYGLYVIFMVGVYVKKKSGYFTLLTGIAAGVNFLLNTFFIPRWGMFGAAWATVLSYGIMTGGIYWISQKYYPIPYEWGRILKLLVFIGLIWASVEILELNAWQKVIALAFFPGLLRFGRFLDVSELRRLRAFFSR